MSTEIKRGEWPRFYRKFNAANLYRPARLLVVEPDGGRTIVCPAPFMGIALTREGRKINGIQFLAGQADAERIVEPIITVADPSRVTLDCDDDGLDYRLHIQSQTDSREVVLELTGARQSSQGLVAKVAYSLYERRGYAHGNDRDDWHEAERKVREVETQLTC
jgi:hypothetical protein